MIEVESEVKVGLLLMSWRLDEGRRVASVFHRVPSLSEQHQFIRIIRHPPKHQHTSPAQDFRLQPLNSLITMSTLNTATLHSDDEDDGDFVPTASPRKIKKRRINPSKRSKTEDGSESDSSSGTSGEDEPNIDDEETKKLKVEQVEAEALIRKQKAAEMFASMREEVSTPVLSGSKGSEEKKSSVEMVEIRRPRQFAGETI